MNTLTQARLQELLHYDPDTGVFTRRVWTGPNVKVGSVAGCKIRSGHIHIKLCGKRYYAHRLAWLYMTGTWPILSIDHINGIADDNRFSNLRVVTHSVNLQNLRRARKDNRSGMIGVHERGGKFRATIRVGGKNISLGTFASADAAHDAYVNAKRRLHPGSTL